MSLLYVRYNVRHKAINVKSFEGERENLRLVRRFFWLESSTIPYKGENFEKTNGAIGNKSESLVVNVQLFMQPSHSRLFFSVYFIMTYRTYGNKVAFRIVSTFGMVFFMMKL